MGQDGVMGSERYVRVNGSWVPATDSPVAGEFVFETEGGDLTPVGMDAFSFSVEIGSATDVSYTSATLNGEVTDLSNVGSVDVSFSYIRAGEAPPASGTGVRTLDSTGTFSATVSGLDPGTIYECWAVATARGESVSSGVNTFTTND